CNQLEQKYEWDCYLNHAGYLVGETHSLKTSTEACLKASERGSIACLQGIGLMATNPSWQQELVEEDRGSLVKNAVWICNHFPDGHKDTCIVAAVDNLANFDRTDTTRIKDFCSSIQE